MWRNLIGNSVLDLRSDGPLVINILPLAMTYLFLADLALSFHLPFTSHFSPFTEYIQCHYTRNVQVLHFSPPNSCNDDPSVKKSASREV